MSPCRRPSARRRTPSPRARRPSCRASTPCATARQRPGLARPAVGVRSSLAPAAERHAGRDHGDHRGGGQHRPRPGRRAGVGARLAPARPPGPTCPRPRRGAAAPRASPARARASSIAVLLAGQLRPQRREGAVDVGPDGHRRDRPAGPRSRRSRGPRRTAAPRPPAAARGSREQTRHTASASTTRSAGSDLASIRAPRRPGDSRRPARRQPDTWAFTTIRRT